MSKASLKRSSRADSSGKRARSAARARASEALTAYVYLIPATLVLGFFSCLPIFYAFYISLHRWTIIKEGFVGLGNYARLAQDTSFWHSMGVTVWYVLGSVPLTIGLGLLVALALFTNIRGRGLYRTIYFLPYVTSVVAAAMVWRWIYNPDVGILNYLMARVGLNPGKPMQWLLEPTGLFALLLAPLHIRLPDWAAGPSLALVAVTAMSVWNGLGFNMVIFLAGLGSVPREMQEAARIDGATEWGVFRFITWPLLSPVTFFLLIIGTIRAFQAFNQIYVMTDGGPLDTTRVITMTIFRTFYESTDIGYGAAQAFVLFLVILALTLVQFRIARHRVVYD